MALHLSIEHLKLALGWKERNSLFNDAHNTFYLRLCGVRHMVMDLWVGAATEMRTQYLSVLWR